MSSSSEPLPDSPQARALASAIRLRNRSLRDEGSLLVRRGYRTQMRAQAFKWRQAPGDAVMPSC